ncbi:DUF4280 domain-containing protein [Flavobacterium sp.]|uniref:DUF4280 domain-containing protein n=1 Tax=Flavobacterium sp. TaxID=239 RepID=UPI00286B5A35|nr:DUF4280 domain-containing protein [Flavobacterium sp.]
MSDNIALPQENIAEIEAERSKKVVEIDKKEKEKDKAEEDQQFVIDGTIIQCTSCMVPIGTLKVNFDTPTIQNKKTATVKEKSALSLKFSGNCLKSPYQASPCMAVMQLGEWQDVGTTLVQDQKPLIKKSTIMCNFGGSKITITKSGQINVPSVITGKEKEKEKEIQYVNGHFYNEDGAFEGKVDIKTNTGDVIDVYTCTGKGKSKDKDGKEIDVYNGIKLMKENDVNITHSDFCYIAYVVKMEAGGPDFKELKCIAYSSYNYSNTVTLKKGEKSKWKQVLAGTYSSVDDKQELTDTSNNQKSKLTRKAIFYVLNGEDDLTNGATFWDGTDFLAWGNSETNPYNNLGQNKFDEYKFIEIPKDIYDSYLAANRTSTKYPDRGNHNEKTHKGTHEHITKKVKKKILDKDKKPVLGKDGKPTFEEVEVPSKIKYAIPAADFENQDYWKSGNFYYDTGVNETYGISAMVSAGESIFWKKTKIRLTSETIIKK